jgi:hypothetical protein
MMERWQRQGLNVHIIDLGIAPDEDGELALGVVKGCVEAQRRRRAER